MNRKSIMRFSVSLFLASSNLPVHSACTSRGTSWDCPAGSAPADVQAAINNMDSGAIINFAAGTYTWGTTINLPSGKSWTLSCSSPPNCAINLPWTGTVLFLSDLVGINTNLFRITGFTFQNSPADATPIWFDGYGYGGGTMMQFRIDHNVFSNLGRGSLAITLGDQDTADSFFGVIDHNTFTGALPFFGVKVFGPGPIWSSTVRGTSQNTFIEDNTFNFASGGDMVNQCIDGWGGATVVYRHNLILDCNTEMHGVVHNTTANFEAYANSFVRNEVGGTWTDGTRLINHQGSNEYYVWNNSFTVMGPIAWDAFTLTHYRSASCAAGNNYDCSVVRCDGTNTNSSKFKDGNVSPSIYYGYPCWNQPGRAQAGGNPPWGTLAPMYNWMNRNTADGSLVPLSVEDPFGTNYGNVEPPSPLTHVHADRDYYTAVSNQAQTSPTSPFNGTTGMGFGSLANRPTTCTHTTAPDGDEGGGVGYFATDMGAQGTLYRCSSANTWTIQYTPYTYPHPLVTGGSVAGAAPAKPIGLSLR